VAFQFDFISSTDKPALLGLTTPEYVFAAQTALGELGFKVHLSDNHEDFRVRFFEVPYQVVILEELFAASLPADNVTLLNVQNMPMLQRRHATFFLLGLEFQTLNPFQAFQQSVHAVIHPAELSSLQQIIPKVVAENDLFLNIFRDTQLRIAQGRA
jgi:hypothetical protein